jgi:hypothetical protein
VLSLDRLSRWLLAGILALLVTPPSAVTAQTVGATMGGITGTVTDATGAVLNNVTVIITSDAIMGSRTASTNADGYYRFAAVTPGVYRVDFRLDGFAVVSRTDIHVGIGTTATVDTELVVDSVRETVDVAPASPVVDTQSAAMTVNYEARHLATLPGSRSMFSILASTPGIIVSRSEVGGSGGEAGGQYSAYGTRGANRPMLEGINVSGIFPSGLTLNFGSFDEVSVLTAAHTAEWSAPGVHMQFVTKSGGNQYRAALFAGYENRNWQATNIDDDQIRHGAHGGSVPPDQANRLWSYHDVNADVGGYLKRDRLWWYASFRDLKAAARQVNFAVRPVETRLTNYTGKSTYQMTPSHRFIAFAHAARNYQPTRLDAFAPAGGNINVTTAINETAEATVEQDAWAWVWKGEWNWVVREALFVEARAGQFGHNRPQRPRGAGPRFEDLGTLAVRGGNRDWEEQNRRSQFVASMTYFSDRGPGSHQFKAGTDIIHNTGAEIWRHSYPGDVLHVLRDDEPVEVYLFETPSRSLSGLMIAAAHASDSWRLTNRLTLNLGMRFERFRLFLPEQSHPVGRFNETAETFAAVDNLIDWNSLVPRVSAIFDFTGTGQTVAKASYAVYWNTPGTDVGFNANPNARVWWRNYVWTDPNGSGVWEPGEETQLRRSRGGVAMESVDPDLTLPLLREVAGWIEHALPGGMGLRSGVVWRTEGHHFARRNASTPFDAFNVPVLIPDPGEDGTSGTADDGASIQGFNLASEFLRTQTNIVSNIPNSDTRYVTWDLTANKRLNGRWSLLAGAAYTWHGDQSATYAGQPVRNNAFALTPNDLINTGVDGRHEFTTWTAKILATWRAPWDIQLSPSIRHQSGQPYGRTFATTLNYGVVRILAEPIGTRRMDNVTLVDMTVEKSFLFGGSRRFAVFLDIFNLLNGNPEQNANWSSGSFQRPLNIVPPRIARVGLSLDW